VGANSFAFEAKAARVRAYQMSVFKRRRLSVEIILRCVLGWNHCPSPVAEVSASFLVAMATK
jgi:hypothetical protein